MIGFLLGAGFSKALHENMPLMGELLNRCGIYGEVPDSVAADIEQALSYLWTNYPWLSDTQRLKNEALFLEVTDKIHEIISEAEFSAWQELSQNMNNVYDIGWKSQLAEILSNEKVSVVLTMNYDTLIERFMIGRRIGKLLYPAPLQRLDGIWNQLEPSPIPYTYNPLGDIGGFFTPNLFKLHGSLSWYSLNPLDSSSVIYGLDMNRYYLSLNTNARTESGILRSVIVPPVADKSSLYSNKVLRAQWIGAQNLLQQCNELFCVGYSFPASDFAMNLFLKEACSNVTNIHLVNKDRDIDLIERAAAIFGKEVYEGDHFFGNDCVEQMTQVLVDRDLLLPKFPQ